MPRKYFRDKTSITVTLILLIPWLHLFHLFEPIYDDNYLNIPPHLKDTLLTSFIAEALTDVKLFSWDFNGLIFYVSSIYCIYRLIKWCKQDYIKRPPKA